jgi:hypothetical protein
VKKRDNGQKFAATITKQKDIKTKRDEISGIIVPMEVYRVKKVKNIDGCLKIYGLVC